MHLCSGFNLSHFSSKSEHGVSRGRVAGEKPKVLL